MKNLAIIALLIALLTGGVAYAGPNAQGVQVPTLSEFNALEARVSALENATTTTVVPTSTTTTVPPTTSTTVPPTTTTTVPSTPVTVLPLDGVVPCDQCTVVGVEGVVYDSVDLNGRTNVILRDVYVDGSLGDSGPLQSGTVNIRGATNIELRNVQVINSPRSCFSLEGSTNVTLDAVRCVGAEHLAVHGGFVNDITIINSEFTGFSGRNVDIGWESGAIKLLRGENITIRGNYIHDGNGPGVWLDGGILGAEVLENRIDNLSAEGIFIEISRQVNIEGNTVLRAPNAITSSRMNWCYGAGILISTSDLVTVVGNEVTSSVHGILVIDQSWRGDTPQGYDAGNYSVVGNTVNQVNKVGACEDVGSADVFDGLWSDNTFLNVSSLLRPL